MLKEQSRKIAEDYMNKYGQNIKAMGEKLANSFTDLLNDFISKEGYNIFKAYELNYRIEDLQETFKSENLDIPASDDMEVIDEEVEQAYEKAFTQEEWEEIVERFNKCLGNCDSYWESYWDIARYVLEEADNKKLKKYVWEGIEKIKWAEGRMDFDKDEIDDIINDLKEHFEKSYWAQGKTGEDYDYWYEEFSERITEVCFSKLF